MSTIAIVTVCLIVLCTAVVVVNGINIDFTDRVVVEQKIADQQTEKMQSVYRNPPSVNDERLTTNQVFYC